MRFLRNSTPDLRDQLLQSNIGRMYLSSWLVLRMVVGLLGLLLPIALILCDIFWLAGSPTTRGSLSAYYHSGMRDVFVGTLWTIGFFLIAYLVFHATIDNLITVLAGTAAVVVALFPTYRDNQRELLTPWQQKLGEGTAAHVHLCAAGCYIGLLALMSLRFAQRESSGRAPRYRWFYIGCGAAMIGSLLFLLVTHLAHITSLVSLTPLLIAEFVCTVAFGLSWILKGDELRRILLEAKRSPTHGSAPLAAAPGAAQPPPS
jgi:hypothetical protein